MKIRFVSKNDSKISEVGSILQNTGIEIIPFRKNIEELQTENVQDLVKDKLLKAFTHIGKPVIVEHTGLYLQHLNGFPAGLTQIFWDKLQADKFSETFAKCTDRSVKAVTLIGFCDGKKLHYFDGEIEGSIAETPVGNRDFQWDCIFIPKGFDKTFAELGEEKNRISMRRIAFEKFLKHLKENKWIS